MKYAFALPLLFAATAQASPIPYALDLYATDVRVSPNASPGNCANPHGWPGVFSCAVAAGDHYTGSFTVDDADLHTGPLPVSHFLLTIDAVTWAQDWPSAFSGLRSIAGDTYFPMLSFVVADGVIASFGGEISGVYGASDPPYVDFYSGQRWASEDLGLAVVQGTYTISRRVDEPAAWLLLLFLLIIVRRLNA